MNKCPNKGCKFVAIDPADAIKHMAECPFQPGKDWQDELLTGPPGRPQHPDMMKLSSILLQHDGPTTDPTAGPFDMEATIREYIDPETLTYAAMTRASVLLERIGIQPTLQMLSVLASCWVDAFIVGNEWKEHKNG